MTQLLFARYKAADCKLKELVGRARQITVRLDEWTKKGLSMSFLGVSACFYNPDARFKHELIAHLDTRGFWMKCRQSSRSWQRKRTTRATRA